MFNYTRGDCNPLLSLTTIPSNPPPRVWNVSIETGKADSHYDMPSLKHYLARITHKCHAFNQSDYR